MKRIFALVFIFALAVLPATAEERHVNSISGRISSVDWVGSSLSIDTGGDEITVNIADDTKITAGTEDLTLADLNQNDNVAVDYYDGGLEIGWVATRIVDTSGNHEV
jgi:hypothetical protein